jgi:hypothetical protein
MFQSIVLLQFLLFALALAAPVDVNAVQENAWKYGTGGGVIGFIVLILDIMVFSTFPVSFVHNKSTSMLRSDLSEMDPNS